MAQNDAQDRHLPASARRLKQAREDGQVPRSRDLGHALALGAGLLLALILLPRALGPLSEILLVGLRFDAQSLRTPGALEARLGTALGQFLQAVLPVGAALMAVAVLAGLALGGWNWTLKPLQPKFDKLNPLTGLAGLFSSDKLVDTLKACGLALAIVTVAGFFLAQGLEHFAGTLQLPLPAAAGHLGGLLLRGLGAVLGLLLLFALVDAPLQHFQHAKRLRMSHQEAKQEHKEQEGSPEVKGRLRQLMRQRAQQRMFSALPTADLVVTNPTHYAVALKYEEGSAGAPRIVAVGADLVALRIRKMAAEHGVPVLEAPPLARALWAHGELDREIPVALYAAVAQVLAHVYQLKAALAGQAPMPGSLPPVPVPAGLDPHTAPAAG